MAQTTANYGFNIAEGTDVVNLLTQCYPNFTSLDSILKRIDDNGVTTASETKSGTVHQLVRTDTNCNIFRFTATSNFVLGDSFTVDGSPVSAVTVSGAALQSGDFVINSNVLAIVNGGALTVFAGGSAAIPDAEDIPYDNSVSGLTATDVQAAIDEVVSDIPVVPASYAASAITYDNTGSGLTASDVQDAIDELAASITPPYDGSGLRPTTGVTLVSGGYYIKNGYCHVDVTVTHSGSMSTGTKLLGGFPPATTPGSSPYYLIGSPMNHLQMAYQSGEQDSSLKADTTISAATRRFIGSYETTITP